jgi:hypothetical protein
MRSQGKKRLSITDDDHDEIRSDHKPKMMVIDSKKDDSKKSRFRPIRRFEKRTTIRRFEKVAVPAQTKMMVIEENPSETQNSSSGLNLHKTTLTSRPNHMFTSVSFRPKKPGPAATETPQHHATMP